MSSDLVRKVTVACGLLPSSMQYAQKENYEKFLHEAGCSKDDLYQEWPPRNLRDKGVTKNGRVRKGLTKKATPKEKQPEPFLEINTAPSDDCSLLTPIPRIARQRAVECRALIGTNTSPPMANPRKRRLVHIRRMEMILEWGGKSLKAPEQPQPIFPSPPRFRRLDGSRSRFH
eukprot:TRINITY_DN9476_c0_g1_i1.p1 TRINITY_DN9476_c0_g1~~TRINITY_DN9476_c0_g1_i1.p1  ORF type:complete len:173 (+),score=17.64 TRINITY_DN9476_c0_g1_i1:146-664(+)